MSGEHLTPQQAPKDKATPIGDDVRVHWKDTRADLANDQFILLDEKGEELARVPYTDANFAAYQGGPRLSKDAMLQDLNRLRAQQGKAALSSLEEIRAEEAAARQATRRPGEKRSERELSPDDLTQRKTNLERQLSALSLSDADAIKYRRMIDGARTEGDIVSINRELKTRGGKRGRAASPLPVSPPTPATSRTTTEPTPTSEPASGVALAASRPALSPTMPAATPAGLATPTATPTVAKTPAAAAGGGADAMRGVTPEIETKIKESADLMRRVLERNEAQAREIAALKQRLSEVEARASGGMTEAHAAVVGERDALRRLHGLRDADASKVFQIAHEKFALQTPPSGATAEQRAAIERKNALHSKVLRSLEKRRYVIAEMGETIRTDEGRRAKMDALARHLERPWWQRFGTEALFSGVGALSGFGAVKALPLLASYAGLGGLATLGAPFAGAAAAAGASFTFLWRKLSRDNDIGRGRRMWHKSPFTSAAIASLASGVTTAVGPTIIPFAGKAKGFLGMIINKLFSI